MQESLSMSWKNYPLDITDFLAANRTSKVGIGNGAGGSLIYMGGEL